MYAIVSGTGVQSFIFGICIGGTDIPKFPNKIWSNINKTVLNSKKRKNIKNFGQNNIISDGRNFQLEFLTLSAVPKRRRGRGTGVMRPAIYSHTWSRGLVVCWPGGTQFI